MSDDLLRLVKDGGKLFVERNSTLFAEPVAVRMWWPVRNVSYTPGAVHHDEGLAGAALLPLPTGSPGPDYRLAEWQAAVWLPQGGRTVAVRRWEAEIPPPKGARVVTEPWLATGRDVFWRHGAWLKEIRHGRRVLPVPWDRLVWRETAV